MSIPSSTDDLERELFGETDATLDDLARLEAAYELRDLGLREAANLLVASERVS